MPSSLTAFIPVGTYFLLLLVIAGIGIAIAKFMTRNSQTDVSFEDTKPETMVEPVPTTKFTDQCVLLSKECRDNDLWIIFIDEYANMHEELQVKDCELCIDKGAA